MTCASVAIGSSTAMGFVKFTFSALVRVVPQAHIVRVSDGQSHVDFPLWLFNLTTPASSTGSVRRRR
jgi:hypothetical protein